MMATTMIIVIVAIMTTVVAAVPIAVPISMPGAPVITMRGPVTVSRPIDITIIRPAGISANESNAHVSGISGMAIGVAPDRDATGQWNSDVGTPITGVVGQRYGGADETEQYKQYCE